MINIEFIYSFVLCTAFLIVNFCRLGLRNKTCILPSTFFSMMWGLTSIGAFLYSNMLIGDNDYYIRASYLQEIASYQLSVLGVIFVAFLLAHFRKRKISVVISDELGQMDISAIRSKMRWFLYLFFIIGLYRLISVLSVTGLDYSAMRSYYLSSRSHFSVFDSNLIRVAAYLSQFVKLYVCILGIETALREIRFKQLTKDFLMFIPFHMSLGGRLFLLAFFAPFIFSYLLTFFTVSRKNGKKIDKKFLLILLSPLIMLVILQILKMDEIVNLKTIEAYSTEIFYTTSAYIHMNELWASLPSEYSLGYGLNTIGIGSSVYNHVMESWSIEENAALVCVPSMIPQAFLDFGPRGSLLFFFIVFYCIEDKAISCLKTLTIKNVLLIVLLCQIAYQTASSSSYDLLRAFIVGYISLVLFIQMTKLKMIKYTEKY